MQVIYQTLVGSRLHGLDHEGSDFDYFTVLSHAPPQHHRPTFSVKQQSKLLDRTVTDLNTWVQHCEEGSPQALEAMFSEKPIIDHVPALRNAFRANTGSMRRVYMQLIFDHTAGRLADKPKAAQHSFRLALNLAEARRRGRFNPTLSPEDRFWMELHLMRFEGEELLHVCQAIALGLDN